MSSLPRHKVLNAALFTLFILAPSVQAQQRLSDRDIARQGLAITVSVERSCISIRPEDVLENMEREILQLPKTPPPSRRTMGSGTLLSKHGEVVIVHTSVEECQSPPRFKVDLQDGKSFVARMLGRDTTTGIGLLKIDNFVPANVARPGSSQALQPGDRVWQFGSFETFQGTISSGIVSSTSRMIPDRQAQTFIQSDALIGLGMAGGPMLNEQGEWVGLNSLAVETRNTLLSPTLGFAIPVEEAMRVVADLRKDGRVRRGKLGVILIDDEQQPGPVVSKISPNSPAATMGLAIGDVIASLDDHQTRSSNALTVAVAQSRAGDVVRLRILRQGKAIEVKGALAEQDGEKAF